MIGLNRANSDTESIPVGPKSHRAVTAILRNAAGTLNAQARQKQPFAKGWQLMSSGTLGVILQSAFVNAAQ